MLHMDTPLDRPNFQTDAPTSWGFTFSNSHLGTDWSDFRRLTWPQLVEVLTSHVPGIKEGSCLTPAAFRGSRRHKSEADRIDVAFLDSDSGLSLAEIEAALKSRGWEGVVSSTHSHMSARTRVGLGNWDKFFSRHPDATAEQFLIESKGYLPRIAAGAHSVETTDEYVFIQHQPCPKFRVAIPLERPWLAADYPSQDEANAAWKERIEALAAALNLDHDQACTDTSRLFYLPRKPANGVVPETAVIAGHHCDLFALPAAAISAPDLFAKHQVQRENERDTEYLDPIDGEIVDLAQWIRDCGTTFLIAKALRARKPGVLTGHVSDAKVHIDCPNAAAHTDPARDGATYVVNAGASQTKGFVIHCRHAHCEGKDRIFFVRRMLEMGWLACDDLRDARFQVAAERPAADQQGERPDHAVTPLPLVWFNDIAPSVDVQDFVQGVLLENSAAVIYGDSNAGKTFWTTDLALHVAAGRPWNGRRVEQGGVIYCILEGGNGFKNRVACWREQHGMAGQNVPFAAIPASINMLDPDADTPRLIATIQAAAAMIHMPVKLIVIDTLARAMAGGNENSSEDMGRLVLNMDAIREATGACVLFIHHSGKDQARGARGHSSLRAAIDTEIEVTAPEGAEIRSATVEKQRETKKGDVFGFRLKVVDIGQNRHGEMVTSCVVEATDETPEAGKNGKNGNFPRVPVSAQVGIRALQNALSRTGGKLPYTDDYPAGAIGVAHSEWRHEFYQLHGDTNPENRKKAFQNAERRLVADSLISARNGLVWFVRRSMEAGK